MIRTHFDRFSLVTGLFIVLAVSGRAATVVAPYAQNFDGYVASPATVTDFVESNGTQIQVVNEGPGDNALQASISGVGGSSVSAAVQVSGLSTAIGSGFFMSQEITPISLTAPSGSTINVGMGAVGDIANFGGSNNQYRVLLFGANANAGSVGQLIIYEGGTGKVNSGTTTLPFNLNTTYTMTLTGTYLQDGLQLVATVTAPGQQTLSVTYLDTTPIVGTYFGNRTAIATATGGTDAAGIAVNYDNFEIRAVPEPSLCVLLVTAGGVLAARRRRLIA